MSEDLAAYQRTLNRQLLDYAQNVKKLTPEHLRPVTEETDPVRACDVAASFIPLTTAERLDFLRASNPVRRYEILIGVLDRELESVRLKNASRCVSRARWRRTSASTT